MNVCNQNNYPVCVLYVLTQIKVRVVKFKVIILKQLKVNHMIWS